MIKDENYEKGKVKERLKTITIIVLIIIIIILLLRGCAGKPNGQMEIIVDNETALQDTSNGQIRIKLSPVITVNNGLMENLDFCNYNENRLLKLKIMVDDNCVYESNYIKEGEILKSDSIDTKSLKKGENEAIAQVYSFDTNKELIGQTNVAFKLNYIS